MFGTEKVQPPIPQRSRSISISFWLETMRGGGSELVKEIANGDIGARPFLEADRRMIAAAAAAAAVAPFGKA